MHTPWEVVVLSQDLEWRRSLSKALETNEIDVIKATSIAECREIVARGSIGLIFWDSHLGGSAYPELLRAVQEVDPRTKIVVVSHNDGTDQRPVASHTGAFGVLRFPCQPTDIEWVISRAIRAERVEWMATHARELRPLL